jgi:hypothetical protein
MVLGMLRVLQGVLYIVLGAFSPQIQAWNTQIAMAPLTLPIILHPIGQMAMHLTYVVNCIPYRMRREKGWKLFSGFSVQEMSISNSE